MNLLSRLDIRKQLTKTQNNNTNSKALRMIPKGFTIFKLHRILIDFKLSDKPLIDSFASSNTPLPSLGGFIFS